MTAGNLDGDSGGGTNKIDTVIRKYDFVGMGAELETRWLGLDGEQESTRDLADYFNWEVLRSAVEDSDVFTFSGDVDQVYHSLTQNDDPDSTLVRSRLEQSGVDVDEVKSDFSHQTLYRYLKNDRGVTQPEQSTAERKESAIQSINACAGERQRSPSRRSSA